MKEEIRIGSLWAKIRKKEYLTDVLYGFTDGTNVHGHTVMSGEEVIYQRGISGANLMVSGANLILNDNILGFVKLSVGEND